MTPEIPEAAGERRAPPRPARRAGRPVKPLITADGIAEGAIELLDDDGDFTMTQLARHLGVGASALYNHVTGKEEVLARVRELVSDRIDVKIFDSTPFFEALGVWARSYRDAFARHPATIAVFATTALDGAGRTTEMYERVVGAFLSAGWPEEDVMTALVALEDFILGAALDAVAADDMFELRSPDDAPTLSRVTAASRRSAWGEDPALASFEAGLDAMLTGLRARLARLCS
ncbi:TetR/AcrR family transcriptional regulator [Pseudoclavibacter sp. AY1H1]|uniref:TetR/AcrR family transcriptional regulator n=1 Tax=Pseudoclavibacter sp. AY1H1 TaxID=2080584 RepID=UPI000CE7BC93|nr:TetR/AcrR family transcriptional regulator C-terminal domain-containing protein [Pseudoclavibacter sp. AY1H1]PPF36994.1 TetR family transcriptional regulator [Pseudoclavibacter sp. AY1H1]